MSLKQRLIGTIALILVAALIAGSALTYWSAERKVTLEIEAAMVVSKATVERAMQAISRSWRPEQHLAEIVSVFDGDRHVRASLVSPKGDVILTSRRPDLPNSVPAWFAELFIHQNEVVKIDPPLGLAAYGSVVLEADPLSEIDKIWGDARANFSILALLAAVILGCVWWTIERSLKPLGALAQAFGEVGAGRYSVRVPEDGPTDLVPLYRGFNDMTRRLSDMEARNRALGRQLERVQDEERSELARDLHDEVSPFLFAVDVDAAAIQSISRNGKVTAKQAGQLAQRAAAIREATGHMKKHVRAILGQLRPEGAVALGLEEALLHLVQQIEERHPSVAVDLKVDASTFGTQLDATIHRLVREALSNALKHGTPARLSVRVLSIGERVDVEVVDDGGGMRKVSATDSGFGLTGMQERIEALGGSFDVTDVDAPAGVRVHAVLPLRQERATVEGALS